MLIEQWCKLKGDSTSTVSLRRSRLVLELVAGD